MAGKTGTVATKSGPTVDATLEEIPDYIPGSSWDEANQTADQVNGHDLAKDELLDALVGVPFMLTALTFRKGIKRRDGGQAAFVSAEGVIAPEHVLKRRRVNMETLPFEPGAQIVFNDGSTGIYRQILAYLEARSIVELPELPAEGEYGSTKYDLPPGEWTAVHSGEISTGEDGWSDYRVNIRLTCPRGVRISEYENEFNPAGSKTRYLA